MKLSNIFKKQKATTIVSFQKLEKNQLQNVIGGGAITPPYPPNPKDGCARPVVIVP